MMYDGRDIVSLLVMYHHCHLLISWHMRVDCDARTWSQVYAMVFLSISTYMVLRCDTPT